MPYHVYYFIFFTSSSLSLPFSFPCFFFKGKWEKIPHKTLKFLVSQVILLSCWLYIIIIYVLSKRSTKNNILYKKVGIFSTGLKESEKTSLKCPHHENNKFEILLPTHEHFTRTQLNKQFYYS